MANIIIIDSDVEIAHLIKTALTRGGHYTHFYNTSKNETLLPKLNDYDLIISDATMAFRNGLDISLRTRKIITPIVLLTGGTSYHPHEIAYIEKFIDKISLLGTSAILTKPIRNYDLISTVDMLLDVSNLDFIKTTDRSFRNNPAQAHAH